LPEDWWEYIKYAKLKKVTHRGRLEWKGLIHRTNLRGLSITKIIFDILRVPHNSASHARIFSQAQI
jgi:hypothetical protein